jgi:hypothetical protein
MAIDVDPTDTAVQKTRAWTGLWVVVFGDVAIAAIATFGAIKAGGGANVTQLIAILSSAFTAIGTMTTAYFGIRAASNTAQSAVTGAGQQMALAMQQSPPAGGVQPPPPAGGVQPPPPAGGVQPPPPAGGVQPPVR